MSLNLGVEEGDSIVGEVIRYLDTGTIVYGKSVNNSQVNNKHMYGYKG